MERLEDRTLLAAQLVTAGPTTTLTVGAGQEITIPVTYQTFDGTAAALGSPAALQASILFNLTMHYDSSELTFVRFENAKTDNGHQGVVDDLESTVTPDADSNTDRVVQTSFFNFGSAFPVPATDAELKLFDAVFTVSAGFSASTQLNFVRQATGGVVGGGSFEFVGQGITLNPAPSVSIAGTTDGVEGTANGLFTVTQSATTGTNTVVNFSVAGTADDVTDFNIATAGNVTYDAGTNTGTITIPSGMTSATIPIVVLDGNTTVEATEAVSITLTGISSGDAVLGGGTTDSIDITDNDTATFTVDDVTVDEATGNATFTVSLNNPIDTAVSIDVSYGGGTAAGGGTDYDSATDVAMFTANSTTAQTVTVAITNDDLVELTETFTVSLAVNSGTVLGTRSVIVTDQGTGTITDNDTATFTIGDISIGEGGTTATFTVSLDKAIDTAATIDVSYGGGTATGGGTDYDSTTDQVMYSANTTGDRTVTVAINNDNIVELAETFIASLSVNGSLGARSVDVTDQATGTINDNDTATFTIEDVSVNEGDGTATFTVSLSNPIDIAASIDVNYSGTSATGGGTDFDSATDTVTFNSGTNADQTVTVAINDDDIVEATESFAATLAVNAGTVLGARSFNVTDSATGSITDNDTATFTIADATASEEDGTMTFTIALDKAIDTAITLDVTFTPDSASSADFTATTQQVTFPAGDNSSRTVMVPLTSDAIVEGDETFNVDLSVNTGMTPTGGRTINTTDGAVGTITDVDTATVSIAQTTNGAETDSSTPGRFTVTLSNPSSVDTVVSYSVAGTATAGTDYSALSGTVTISANSTSQTIDVTVLGDDIVEDDESIMVTLTGFTARDPQVTLGTASATVNITDDDSATITIGNASVTEGGDLMFTVSTDKQIDTNVLVDVAFADVSTEGAADFANSGQQITLNGNTSSQTVTVSTINDTVVEGTETLTATISLAAQSLGNRGVTGADSGTGTINDNDTAVFSFDQSTSSVNEGPLPNPNNVNVAVTLLITANGMAGTGILEGNLSVDVSDAGGSSATRGAGADFTSTTNPVTLTFSASGTQNAVFTINDDAIKEPNETINLSLTNPTSPSTVDAGNASHVITIIDDDTPQISVAATVDTVDENGTPNLVYTFTRAGDQTDAITVNFEVTGTADANTDFTVSGAASFSAGTGQGTIVIGAGQPTAVLTIDPIGDSDVELDETVQVTVLADTVAPPNNTYNVGAMSSDSGTITNDDVDLTIAADQVSQDEGQSGNTAYTFTVTRSGATDGTTTASYAVTGTGSNPATAADFGGSFPSGTVTFTSGVTTQTITVNVTGDRVVELDEDFVVTLSGASDTVAEHAVDIATSTATSTITNDDVDLTIAADQVSQDEGQSGNTAYTFTVTRSGATDGTTTASYAVTGTGSNPATAADFGGSFPSGTVTFTSGVTTQTITVNVTGDRVVELDEDFVVTLSGASDTVAEHAVDIATSTATSTITNDDVDLTIAADQVSQDEGQSGNTAYTFTVTRSGATDGTTTASYAVTGTGSNPATAADFGGSFPSGTVTFTSGVTTQTITVNVTGDRVVELDEDFVVTLSGASDTVAEHAVDIATSTATSTITNDDVDLTIAADQVSQDEGQSGNTAYTFTVTRSGATDGTTTASYAVTGTGSNPATAADFGGSFPSGTVTFTSGVTTQTITVNVTGDRVVELDEDFVVTLSGASDTVAEHAVDIATSTATSTITNDDVDLTIAADQVSQDEGQSGNTAYTFTVTRSGATDGTTTASYAVTGTGSNPATAADFGGSFPSGTVTFTSGVTTQTITVNVTGDRVVELDEDFVVTLSGASDTVAEHAVDIATSTATSTITNDDVDLTIAADQVSQDEGQSGNTAYTFTVTRSGATDGTTTASYAVTGTGSNPATAADFGGSFPSGTVTFTSGVTTQTITVNVTGDRVVELDEDFVVTLSGASDTVAEHAVDIATSTATSTITNDDVDLTIAADQVSQDEGQSGNTAYTFTVTRSGATDGTTTASYAVTGTGSNPATAADFGGSFPSGTVTFTSGVTTQTITVNVTGDRVVELDEDFVVTLSGASDTVAEHAVDIATSTATSTITNDDVDLTIAADQVSQDEGQSGNTAYTFTVTRSGATDGTTTASYAVTGTGSNPATAADFGGSFPSGTVTFTSGVTTQTITVNVTGDRVVELDEDFVVTLSGASDTVAEHAVDIATSTATSTITNDDVDLTIAADQVSQDEGQSGNTAYTFTVTRSGATDGTTTASYAVTGTGSNPATAADFGGSFPSGTVTFTSGVTTQTITVNVTGDRVVELDEDFVVTLSGASDTVAEHAVDIATSTATSTITNDDVDLTIAADQVSQDEGQSGNTAYTFTVTRSGATDGTTTASYAVTGTGSNPATAADFGGSFPSGTVTFTSGVTTQTITVNVTGDRVVELDEDFVVTLSGASDTVAEHAVDIATSTATSTITNDDVDLTIAADQVSQDEGQSGNTAYTFTVTRSGATDGTTTASYAVTGTGSNPATAADFGGSFPSGTVTFTSGVTTQTITVNVTGDRVVELDEDFVVTLSGASDTVAEHAVDIATSTATSTITNDDQAIVSINDVTVNEADGTLTFTLTSDNPIDIPVDIRVFYADVTATGASGGTGGDYDNDSDTVTLAANTTSTSVTVAITDDVTAEEDETFTASLSTATSLGGRVVDLSDTATGTITDNDAIRVSIAVAPATVGEESGVALVYTFTATSAPANDVTVSFDVTGTATFGDDYTVTGAASFNATSGTAVIPMGMTSVEVRITPVDDMDTEGTVDFPDETVILTLTDASVAYNLDPPTSASGNITDDEAVASPSIVNLNDGVDDNVELIIDAGSYVVRSTSGPMMEFFRRSISSVTTLTINGGDNDNDVISINFANGNPVPPVNPLITQSGGVTINGGAGGNDTVTLDNVGASFTTHTYDYANANDGTITLNDGTDDTTINFTGLEPIVNDGTATDIIFNLPTSADDASLEDSGTSSDGLMSLVSNNGTFESTTFVVPTSSLTINGGDGNDTVTFNSADDALVPNDSSNVNSQTVVINGDAGDDVLVGSSFNDVMNGGAGNDVVNGRSGDDTLGGDAGNDTLLGGSGDDNLFGGDGDDRIKGQGGTDTVGGGAGNDEIEGGTGVSSLREEGNVNLTIRSVGDTIILEGLGTDIITGTYVSVVLVGGSSGNQLDASGYAGVVTLDGAGGDDTLIGTSNADSLIGGTGVDRAVLRVRGNVAVTDLGVFGPGGDFLSDVEQLQIEIDDPTGAKVDASTYTLGRVTVIGGDGADTLIGSAQNDFLNGRGGRDQIFGMDGNDRLLGGGSNDLLVGGNGKDTLLGNSGIDTLSGGEGNDRLVGGNSRTVLREENFAGDITVSSNGQAASLSGLGVDTLLGSFKTLELTGDDGPNRIDASGFNFAITLNGGGGDDTLLGGSQGDLLDGGDGIDRIEQTVDLEQILTDTLVTGRGADTLSSIEEAVLIGGDFGTNIDASGFSGNVTLLGNGGGDTLIGGSGNDVLGGGDGNDKLFGQAGNDTADGAAGNDSLVGGEGDDVLLGGAANDTLLGQGGNDTLLGEDGDDSIDGGSGTDTATGIGNGEPDDDTDTISNAETIDNTFMFDFDSLVAGF